MSQLETLLIPTETVPYGTQSFTVRGLGLADIAYIVRLHSPTLADLYAQAIGGTLPDNVHEIAINMLGDFAPLAGLVIACSMDEPQNAALAAKLPLSVQAEALEKIMGLTLIASGGLEKLVEIVAKAMGSAAKLTSLKT